MGGYLCRIVCPVVARRERENHGGVRYNQRPVSRIVTMHNPLSSLPASPWVVRFSPLVAPGGTVLDVACGGGRHARLLASRGHAVEAVDRDADALRELAASSVHDQSHDQCMISHVIGV